MLSHAYPRFPPLAVSCLHLANRAPASARAKSGHNERTKCDTWDGWRIHASQATALNDFMSAEHAQKIDEMIDDAIERSRGLLPARFDPQITARWAAEAKEGRRFPTL